MQTDLANRIQARYNLWLQNQSSHLSRSQNQFLAIRQSGLQQVSKELTQAISKVKNQSKIINTPLLNRNWLETFATGDILECFGKKYEIYKARRCPRIPNGDLLLMSRINQIQGTPGDFSNPAKITAEIDLPSDAWFLDDTSNGDMPLAILLEIALQPCGVLSAWLGTPLRFPDVNYFFRNLDGEIQLFNNIKSQDRTITTHAELTRTTFSGSIIIQHFNFQMESNGESILSGTSSFGYFPEETMTTQIGLDGGKPSQPWGINPSNTTRKPQELPKYELFYPHQPSGKLNLIDKVSILLNDGKYGKGYAMATRLNSPTDWFYSNHFYQDPVMPGSLGIEAILQTFKALIYSINNSTKPAALLEGNTFQWKYRGQVLPKHQKMWVEVHIQHQELIDNKNLFTAEASLWADNIRIYEISNLRLQQD